MREAYPDLSYPVIRGMCGCATGLLGLTFATPMEVLKTKAQASATEVSYMPLMRELGLSGMYKGFVPFFWMVIPS